MNHDNAAAVLEQACEIADQAIRLGRETKGVAGPRRVTTVTITEDTIVAMNHAGNTGVCIAISTAVQVAARMLNEAECIDEIEMDPSVPLFRVKLKHDIPYARRNYARHTFDGLTSVLREIQQMNPAVLDVVERG